MVAHDAGDVGHAVGLDAEDDAFAAHRVCLHDLPFIRGEPSGLSSIAVRDADLPMSCIRAAMPSWRSSPESRLQRRPSATASMATRSLCLRVWPSRSSSAATGVRAKRSETDRPFIGLGLIQSADPREFSSVGVLPEEKCSEDHATKRIFRINMSLNGEARIIFRPGQRSCPGIAGVRQRGKGDWRPPMKACPPGVVRWVARTAGGAAARGCDVFVETATTKGMFRKASTTVGRTGCRHRASISATAFSMLQGSL